MHGNLFLNLFAYLFVSMLRKISNDYLQYLPRNLLSFDISLEVRENFENLIRNTLCFTNPIIDVYEVNRFSTNVSLMNKVYG